MKTTRKTLGILLSCILALTMCIGMATTAFAEDELELIATPTITKTLNIAEGVTVPNQNFVFTFTPGNVDELTTETAPALASVTVNLSDQTIASNKVSKSGNIDFSATTFPHAGVYEYTVAETTVADTATEDWTCDTSTYEMRVYVGNATGGGTEVLGVTFENGTNEKLSTSPTFTNTYDKTIGTESAPALKVTNTTTGTYANLTKEFEYSVTLTAPSTTVVTSVPYTIFKNDDTVKTTGTYTFGTGADGDILLADGEYIVFETLPAGTTYVISEDEDGYIPSNAINSGTVVDANTTGTATNLGDTADVVDFTNEYDEEENPITGLFVDNMPYFILIALAALGFVAFIVKRRSSAK